MGLASLGLSFYVWSAFPYLAPAYGKFLTTFTGASSLMYGFNKFSDHKTVNHIERIKEGANAGKIRVHIALSPLFSYSVVADASQIHGQGPTLRDTEEVWRITIGDRVNEKSGEKETKSASFTLRGDAYVDREALGSLFQESSKYSEVEDAFLGLVQDRAERFTGSNITEVVKSQTQFMNPRRDFMIQNEISKGTHEQVLQALCEKHGYKSLDGMSQVEFYETYKQESTSLAK